MNALFNSVSNSGREKKERWFDPTSRHILLYTLPVIIVWQAFQTLYLVTQIIEQLVAKYLCPTQVIAETDIDPFYEALDRDDELIHSDTTDLVIDLVHECIKLLTFWVGLLTVVNIVENIAGVMLFAMFSAFFVITSYMSTAVFNRKQVGNSFAQRLENYCQIVVIVFQSIVIVIAIVAVFRIMFNVYSVV